MYSSFFGEFFVGTGLKILKEPAETDDVNQFVGDNIQAKRHQRQFGAFFQRSQDSVVLDTDFIKIIGFRPQGRSLALSLIADYLCIGALDDFIGGQFLEGLDIVFWFEPFAMRHFEKVADQLLGHSDGLVDNLDLFPAERGVVMHGAHIRAIAYNANDIKMITYLMD